MSTRSAIVRIRRNPGWEVKPEAEDLDGQRVSVSFGWHLSDDDSDIYKGEDAWIISRDDMRRFSNPPAWLASGDLEFVEDGESRP